MSKGRGKTAGKNRARNALTVLLVLLLLVLAAGVLYRLTGGGVLYRLTGGGGNEPAQVEKIELDKESIIFGGGG